MKLKQSVIAALGLALAVLVVLPVTVQAQISQAEQSNTISTIEAPERADRASTEFELCHLERPSQIQRYTVTCSDATLLDVEVEDVAVSGDHWQVKVKSWDGSPNMAVATAPGPADVFGANARVYSYGGGKGSSTLRALVECSYLHGTNVFPADGVVRLSTDGTCTINSTALPLEDEIDRSP